MNSDFSAQEAVDAERAQIGHEIHDALLPLVAGAKYSMAGYVADLPVEHEDRDRLQQVVQWLEDAMLVGRQILIQAYPPELENTSWVVAAKQTVEACAGDATQVTWDVSDESYEYPLPTAGAAYRVVVEAVRNAVRHGKASKIQVSADRKRIEIIDDGCGFDLGAVPNDRYGVRSMKGRAALINADLKIRSSAGEGTTITLRLLE